MTLIVKKVRVAELSKPSSGNPGGVTNLPFTALCR